MHHMQTIVRLLSSEYRPIVPSSPEPASEEMGTRRRQTKSPQSDKQKLTSRILILGDSGVGKTAMIQQFLKRDLPADKMKSVQLYEETFSLKKSELTLSIVEFGGNGSVLRDWNITRADAFVLVYSLVDKNSFETVRSLKERICKVKHDDTVPAVVVASKSDLYKKDVCVWRAVAELSTCLDWDWMHAEVSTVTENKMVDVFQNVLDKASIDFSLSAALKNKSETRLRRFSIFRK